MTGAPRTGTQLPDRARPRLHDAGRAVAVAVGLVGFRVRLHGRDRIPATGPLVVVSNHSAMVDGILLYGLLHRRVVFLVKHEVFRGFVGRFLVAIGQLPVRRGEPDRTPLLAAVRVLREGGAVGVFPEGTRGAGDVASAQHGAAWLARSSGATVLPVACRGTRRPAGRGRRFRPRVDVLVGAPFAMPPGRGRAALAVGTDLVRTRLVDLVAELDERLGGAAGGSGGRRAGGAR